MFPFLHVETEYACQQNLLGAVQLEHLAVWPEPLLCATRLVWQYCFCRCYLIYAAFVPSTILFDVVDLSNDVCLLIESLKTNN